MNNPLERLGARFGGRRVPPEIRDLTSKMAEISNQEQSRPVQPEVEPGIIVQHSLSSLSPAAIRASSSAMPTVASDRGRRETSSMPQLDSVGTKTSTSPNTTEAFIAPPLHTESDTAARPKAGATQNKPSSNEPTSAGGAFETVQLGDDQLVSFGDNQGNVGVGHSRADVVRQVDETIRNFIEKNGVLPPLEAFPPALRPDILAHYAKKGTLLIARYGQNRAKQGALTARPAKKRPPQAPPAARPPESGQSTGKPRPNTDSKHNDSSKRRYPVRTIAFLASTALGIWAGVTVVENNCTDPHSGLLGLCVIGQQFEHTVGSLISGNLVSTGGK